MSTESEEIIKITEAIENGKKPLEIIHGTLKTEKEKLEAITKHLNDTGYNEHTLKDMRERVQARVEKERKEREREERKEEEGEGEGEKKHYETMGELIDILMSGAIKEYALGKVTLLESIFYATIMPVLVTGGADEDSIITILSFLKNPDITPGEIDVILTNQHKLEEEKIAHLGKIGDVLTMTTQSFGLAAIEGANPKVKDIMNELNASMKNNILPAIIKAQELQKTAADASKIGTETDASKIGTGAVKEPEKGGAPSKKINKTKVKQRIHNSIKKFHKTNNLKTLKREIHRMMRRFTRGIKK